MTAAGSKVVKDIYTQTVTGGTWTIIFSNDTATTEIYALSLHDALPIYAAGNPATQATQAITVDETSPTIAITTPIAGDNTINKAEAANVAGVTIGRAHA